MISHSKTQRMVVTAMLIGLATVLSFVKLFEAPMGGSVTLLSMLPLCLISIRYGVRWGGFACCIHALLQLLLDGGALARSGISAAAFVGSVVFDYLLAFGVLGLAGILCYRPVENEPRSHKKSVKNDCRAFVGVMLAVFLRFLCHTISGCIFFSEWCWEGWNVVVYSICYNGAYMLPECIFTSCGAWVMLRLPMSRRLFAPMQ